MSILAGLHHVTRYQYDRPIGLGPQVVRLRPAPHCRTRVPSYSLKVTPAEHFVNWQQDPNGNWLARFVFPEKTREFSVTVDLVADMAVVNPFDFFVEPFADTFPFAYPAEFAEELAPYLDAEPAGPRSAAFLASIPRDRNNTVDFLVELNQRLQREIRYLIRMEAGRADAGRNAHGRRRARAATARWLLVQILRHLGLAARFVSGYLIQLRPDVQALDGPVGAAHDFTDLHAWAEVYIPGAGWIGLDATSGLLCGEGHLPLAATPHFRAAAPISGAVEPAKVTFFFDMKVTRDRGKAARHLSVLRRSLGGARRARREGRRAISRRNDVRLTMGGEPTFVSVDDYQSAEWNTAALGPTKRIRADDLIRRLRDRFAPGGLLHYGQGKWYPGEPLPRWAFALYWRRDGEPIWRDPALIASETGGHRPLAADAERFTQSASPPASASTPSYRAARLRGPGRAHAQGRRAAGQHRSRAIPRSTIPQERARIMRAFDRRLGEPAGYVLPVQRWTAQAVPGWISELWRLRRGRLFLMPGDSPIGFRLPLKSLPHVRAGRLSAPGAGRSVRRARRAARSELLAQAIAHRSQDAAARAKVAGFSPRPAGARARRRVAAPSAAIPGAHRADGRAARRPALRVHAAGRTAGGLSRTARRGRSDRGRARHAGARRRLRAAARPAPERHQGDARSRRHRGQCSSRRQLARRRSTITRTLYEETRLSRLGTDKFMIDGRHTGTGGGNHVVLGGPTAADSPFLRRPDLLKSLILYWQRHPSLSYLFSGLFIGPTSQAPRVDEARHDQLYELEIALAMVPAPGEGEPPRPWLVDRLFRNLLVDVTGNTHRAELCIDKLFSPDGPTGRLGLVEFRSFEMPPDARMSLAQQLLLRALVAWFWRVPQRGALVRWGTALHDRFMLGHFVWEDFLGVLDDLRGAGYHFDPEWFHAQREFRFPLLRRGQPGRREPGAATGARALVRPRRGYDGRRHRAFRRFVGRAPASEGRGAQCGAPRRHLQRATPAADLDRPGRRICRRRPLQGVEIAGGAAPDDRGSRPAHLRHFRSLEPRVRSAAASTTSPIPAGATMRPSRSTPTRRKRGAWRASRIIGHTPGAFDFPGEERTLDYPMTLDLRRPTHV